MKEKNLILFKATVFAMILLEIYSVIELIKTHKSSYTLFFIAVIIVSIAFILQLVNAGDNVHKFVAKLDNDIDLTERESLYSFPAASVITDENNRIVWCNKYFLENVVSSDPFGLNISEIFRFDMQELKNNNCVCAEYDGKKYNISCETKCQPLTVLCFQDITDYCLLQDRYKLTRPSVMIIMIDNYDDLFQNLKESDKARAVGDIEKLFEEFIASTNGFIRKSNKDLFVAVIEEQHLSQIIEQRFRILDNARKIKVSERLYLTLSIGVGHGASTLAESELYAKQALDMALGRGGDQAAVKTDSGFKFYGGVSKGIEKQSRIKTRIIATALQELISSSSDVLLMGHRFGDLDSIGAATGLAASIHNMGKSARVIADAETTLAKQIISRITEAGEGDMFIDEKTALEVIDNDTLLIIVDTHNKSIIESPAVYNKAKHIVVIDHHRKTVNFIDNAVIFHHEPYASSACEMVTEIIQYFKNAGQIQPHHADALLAGITLDTKNFVVKTGVRTFEAAAFLRKCGADTIIVKSMFSGTMEAYKQKSDIVSSAEIYRRCAVAVAEKENPDVRITAPQASDELLNIKDVDASFVIYRCNGQTCISARSFGAMNVQVIMEMLGGGGHQTMAATQLSCDDYDKVKQMLKEAVDKYITDSSVV